MQRTIFDESHDDFRAMVRDYIEKEVAPHHPAWEQQGHVPREFYRRLGELGILGVQVPEAYGGGGVSSFKYNAIVIEEFARAGVTPGALGVHTNIVLGYLMAYATEEQKKRWLPGMATGELMTAIAMTEPGAGSDLASIGTRAVLSESGTHYVLNGAKTFITGGSQADLILVVCRTKAVDPRDRRAGLSILCVAASTPGFSVGKKLSKIGIKASDTAELAFDDVRVPVEDLLGDEGQAFGYLGHNLPQERLTIALGGAAMAEAAIAHAVKYVQERKVFGQPVASLQNTKFVLAECATETAAARLFADRALELLDRGELKVPDAAMAKLFCTEVAGRVIDKCLQLHGGYGYVTEYPIARLYADTRVSRIYGGTSEVMKSIISKSLGL